jgi:hypothetical protein
MSPSELYHIGIVTDLDPDPHGSTFIWPLVLELGSACIFSKSQRRNFKFSWSPPFLVQYSWASRIRIRDNLFLIRILPILQVPVLCFPSWYYEVLRTDIFSPCSPGEFICLYENFLSSIMVFWTIVVRYALSECLYAALFATLKKNIFMPLWATENFQRHLFLLACSVQPWPPIGPFGV